MARKRTVWIGNPPTHPSFRPYVLAIGQAAVAWNSLHEALRGLFCTLGINDYPGFTAMWYSLRSDRSQRQLLKALARANAEDGNLASILQERIEWLVKVSDSLSEARNVAVHAPLISSRLGVYPDLKNKHPQAAKLLNKDLLAEFRWCRDVAVTLTDFSLRLDVALAEPGRHPLPDIPSLPVRPFEKLSGRE